VTGVPVELATSGSAAPPRSNGELVFEEPWESRMLGVTMALVDAGRFEWSDFQRRLISAVGRWEAEHPDGAGYRYYGVEALESLLGDNGVLARRRSTSEPRCSLAVPQGYDHGHG
jgi:nitrile hydratase accessory protein